MKHLFFLLWLLLLGNSCTSSLMPPNEFDPEVNQMTKKLKRDHRKEKVEARFITAFTKANRIDFNLLDTLLKADVPSDAPYIHYLHKRIRARQLKLEDVLPFRHYPQIDSTQLPFLFRADSLLKLSAVRAADFFYHKAENAIVCAHAGDHLRAREAYHHLTQIKKEYFDTWKQSDSLMEVAHRTGMTYILCTHAVNSVSLYHYLFERELGWAFPHRASDFWHQVDVTPVPGREYQYSASIQLQNLSTGWCQRSDHTYTVEREIQTGEKVIYDDSTHQVKDRVPIMEKVSACVTETTIRQDASGQVYFEVVDTKSGRSVFQGTFFGDALFDRTWVSVTGDQRAFAGCVPTGAWGIPSAPFESSLVEEVLQDLERQIYSQWHTVFSGL